MKRITVRYFDEDRFMQAWLWHKFRPLKYDGYNYTGKINPLDNSWNAYFYEKEIETQKFERFRMDNSEFIEIDDTYLYDDSGKLYLWEELVKAENTYNKYRSTSNIDKPGEWFPTMKKIVNRDKTLERILDIKIDEKR